MGVTGAVFAQAKLKVTSVGAMAPVGVRARTKLWVPLAGMEAGTLGAPVSWLVVESVVWYAKLAGTFAVLGENSQRVAPLAPELISVVKAVAVPPTWTERLEGRTAATSVVGGSAAPVGVTTQLRMS